MPLDGKAPHQVVLDKALARMEPPEDNVLFEHGNDQTQRVSFLARALGALRLFVFALRLYRDIHDAYPFRAVTSHASPTLAASVRPRQRAARPRNALASSARPDFPSQPWSRPWRSPCAAEGPRGRGSADRQAR